MAEERIMTLHPQGKKGVHILKRRYDLIRNFILEKLKQNEVMTFEALSDEAVKELSATFDGKVLWYITSVKLDLEARQEIERIPKTSPHQLRLL
ncbi:MAG: hypothetical protein AAF798_09465 [Bacteroidota bacterium]